MTLQSKLLIVAGILVFLGILSAGYFWGKNGQLNKQIELVEELNEVKLAEKDGQLARLGDRITVSYDKIEEVEKDNTKLREEREKNKAEIEKLKKKVEDAPPETLLAEARRILDTREIWLIDRTMGRLDDNASAEMIKESTAGAEFSLVAFRKAIWIFTDWENFTLEREPNYIKQIKNDAVVKAEQNLVISNLTLSSKTWEEKYYILNDSFTNWKQYVKKKKNVWSWLGDKALTFGLGYLAGKILD